MHGTVTMWDWSPVADPAVRTENAKASHLLQGDSLQLESPCHGRSDDSRRTAFFPRDLFTLAFARTIYAPPGSTREETP